MRCTKISEKISRGGQKLYFASIPVNPCTEKALAGDGMSLLLITTV
jgi:hypothetical protein